MNRDELGDTLKAITENYTKGRSMENRTRVPGFIRGNAYRGVCLYTRVLRTREERNDVYAVDHELMVRFIPRSPLDSSAVRQ